MTWQRDAVLATGMTVLTAGIWLLVAPGIQPLIVFAVGAGTLYLTLVLGMLPPKKKKRGWKKKKRGWELHPFREHVWVSTFEHWLMTRKLGWRIFYGLLILLVSLSLGFVLFVIAYLSVGVLGGGLLALGPLMALVDLFILLSGSIISALGKRGVLWAGTLLSMAWLGVAFGEYVDWYPYSWGHEFPAFPIGMLFIVLCLGAGIIGILLLRLLSYFLYLLFGLVNDTYRQMIAE